MLSQPVEANQIMLLQKSATYLAKAMKADNKVWRKRDFVHEIQQLIVGGVRNRKKGMPVQDFTNAMLSLVMLHPMCIRSNTGTVLRCTTRNFLSLLPPFLDLSVCPCPQHYSRVPYPTHPASRSLPLLPPFLDTSLCLPSALTL